MVQISRIVLARKHDWLAELKTNPVFKALAISLLIHLLAFGGWKIGESTGLLQKNPLSKWWDKKVQPTQLLSQKKQTQQQDIPLTFVEVDQAVAEPPPQAKFYGAANSKAANSEKKTESNQPKIEGQQDKVLKTVEHSKTKAQPLQPSLPTPDTENQEKESLPKKSDTKGNLAFAKPQENKKDANESDAEQKTPRPKPRKLSEVKKGSLGQKMRQDGGVSQIAANTALDVKVTSFGSYDAEFIEAVKQRWYALLEGRGGTVPGKVGLEFRLHYDGRITDMKVVENNVGEMFSLICQKAILDPSPYRRWPIEMRKELKDDFRDVTFTFYYLNH